MFCGSIVFHLVHMSYVLLFIRSKQFKQILEYSILGNWKLCMLKIVWNELADNSHIFCIISLSTKYILWDRRHYMFLQLSIGFWVTKALSKWLETIEKMTVWIKQCFCDSHYLIIMTWHPKPTAWKEEFYFGSWL